MTHIPKDVELAPSTYYLLDKNYKLIHQGKVRDTFELDKERLLVVASNRISIFDFVLNAVVPYKGEYLTALTHFWLNTIPTAPPNHLTNEKSDDLDEILARDYLIVKNMKGQLDPYELIFRICLGGSVYKKYIESRVVAGITLPDGLHKWAELPSILFTPSTKAEVGHDINIVQEEYYNAMPRGREFVVMLREFLQKASDYALSKGIMILDTKFEGSSSSMMLADEILTPDSSRYVKIEDYKAAIENVSEPAFMDKQIVREWGLKVKTPWGTGINNLDPSNPDHLSFVDQLEVPTEVIGQVAQKYQDLFQSLTGLGLSEYQEKFMGLKN